MLDRIASTAMHSGMFVLGAALAMPFMMLMSLPFLPALQAAVPL